MRRLSVPAVLLSLLLAACSSGSGEEDDSAAEEGVRASAEQVAAALVEGEPGELTWAKEQSEAVATAYADTVAGLGGLEADVVVDGVDVTETDATATLGWSWPIGRDGETWEYESRVFFAAAEDGDEAAASGWRPVWSRAIVEPGLGEQGELLVRSDDVARGDITGARGEVLVTQRPVLRFGIDKSRVKPKAAVRDARALARLVDVAAPPFVQRVRKAGDRAFVEAITYRKPEAPDAAVSGVEDIKSARAIESTMALAPTKEFAAPLLGRVGPVTAEMVEEAPETYQAGDIAGVSGLQARYDDRLRGNPGTRVIAFDPGGDERELYAVEASGGEDLALTLDRRLQRTAEDLLGSLGPAASLVAVRPSDGAILAAANGPGTGGQNHATFGQFAPGSTFKVVSALALLRNGLRPDGRVDCPATTTVDGKQFENYDDFPAGSEGTLSFAEAFSLSCNTAFIDERDRLGDAALGEAAASLGVGEDMDAGFPAYFGQVPPPASETERAADLIGQGKVLASPMAMATAVASVQQGSTVVPRLVEGVDIDAPDVPGLTGQEAGVLQDLMRRTASDGTASILADLPGPAALGKTGTAEFDGEDGLQTHAWMVGAQGDLAVAVFVEVGASGSGTAGPVLEQFLRRAG
ncbi:hypothetical protein KUV85_13975 [Nocardioides panacisoli]|uniref:penicillin-binding transpeptidase domain-containing protein n=1 Tax=Nocardioides panacisoli TaxID=627624 RepID=UPI001C635B4C|nr:penicillin-binding transpeptidase domain-containing protein [Nocardioides panacisoli]QYJ03427.1 hypothetical protein KUV85_13975 [Nocardioides panacisoli]